MEGTRPLAVELLVQVVVLEKQAEQAMSLAGAHPSCCLSDRPLGPEPLSGPVSQERAEEAACSLPCVSQRAL